MAKSGEGQGGRGDTYGVSYHIDQDRRLVFIDCIDTIIRNDFIDAQARFAKDPAHDPSFALLLDGLKADFGQLSEADLRAIAKKQPHGAGGTAGVCPELDSQLRQGGSVRGGG